MIKQDELEKIQDKYKNLEKELNQSVNDKDKYVSLSKEYADLKPLYDQVNLYLAQQSELEELNSVINGNDADLIEIATSPVAVFIQNLSLSPVSIEFREFQKLSLREEFIRLQQV